MRPKPNHQSEDVFQKLHKKYPRRLVDKNINALLGYYLTLLELADTNILTKTKSCIMISDTLYHDCVQNHEEVMDIAIDAGFAAFPRNKHNLSTTERFEFIKIWVYTVAENFQPLK